MKKDVETMQKVEWNYSELASFYVNRPDYSMHGLDAMLAIVGTNKGNLCDVGAGVAHLTIPMLEKGFVVDAVEPNDEMREIGKQRTTTYSNVEWYKGTGESTGMPEDKYDLVTFGSSFNVTDRNKALLETSRILKKSGWFACMWNHRDLNDPLQSKIEEIISNSIKGYDYGTRREDQSVTIVESGLFKPCHKIESPITYLVNDSDWVNAWRSHATLERQSQGNFGLIVDQIEKVVSEESCNGKLSIPYITRIWVSQLQD